MANLIIENIAHFYEQTSVLKDISFTASQGSITCILGASGSGKTTLLRLIGGFERLEHGKIMIGDSIMAAEKNIYIPPEKREIGMMFQDYALFPHLTIKQNLLFGLKKNNHSRISWVTDMAYRLGLEKLLLKYPNELSGGEQQRVALLRAIAPEPKLLLLDEPFSGLDPHLRRQIRDEIIAFIHNVGITTMIVTHDPEEASYMGDQLLILDNGHVSQIGTPSKIKKMPATPMIARFFGAVNSFSLDVIEGKITSPILKQPLDVNRELKQVTLQCYPEKLIITEGDDFTFMQRFMVEYGGERVVLEHHKTKQRFIAHCGTMCPRHIGDKVGLSIAKEDIFIFESP